MYTAVGITMLH